MRGTPLSPATYLAAVIGSTVVVIGLQVVAQLLLGVFLLDADWPERPLAFTFAILTGAAAFAALGIAITTIVRTAEGSSAVVNAIYLPMAFISGASSCIFLAFWAARRPKGNIVKRTRTVSRMIASP